MSVLAQATMAEGVERLLRRYVHILDACDLDGWVDLFADEATYQVITRSNVERGLRISHILDDSKMRIRDRVTYRRDVWKDSVNDYYSRHLISAALIDPVPGMDDEAEALSSFAIYTTQFAGWHEPPSCDR